MKLFDKLSGQEIFVNPILGATFLKHNHIKNGGRYCLPKEVVKYADDLGLVEVEETPKDTTEAVRPVVQEFEPDETTEPDISAAARKLAENNGIDWRKVKGSGKDGMIVKGDINDLI